MSVGDVTQPSPTKSLKARAVPLRSWLLRVGMPVAFALFGLLVMIVALTVSYQLLFRHKIHRGVRVWDLNLSGMDRTQARATIADHFASWQIPWELRDGNRVWKVTPAALGVRFDPAATADAAFAVGRSGSLAWNLGEQIRAASQGVQIAPVVLYDETAARQFLQGLADEIHRPVQDASLVINGLEVFEVRPQVGRRLDLKATLSTLRRTASVANPGQIQLPVIERLPRVIDAAIARDQFKAITGTPLTLYVESERYQEAATEPSDAPAVIPGPWQLSREDLAAMSVVGEESVGDTDTVRLNVTLDPAAVRAHLAPISQEISRTASNARFIFNDDTRQLEVIEPSTDGLALDLEATVEHVRQGALGDRREVPLALQVIPAKFNERVTAEELGVTELVASSTSYFAGSSEGRINNVSVAASKFHGILIEPGQAFSFNEWLGEVTEEEGYDESLIIFGNATIPDVGGGICQVSTTAFRTAFWAGLPITERWAHAYRVGYYEQGGQPVGTDATIYSPLVDLKFLNDTPHHLLIETYVSRRNNSLTFKFYSTGNGRVVELEGPEISDVIEHGEPIYKEDPELEPGEIKQIEWATDGMTVVVTRVIRDAASGEVIERETFKSKFRPWDAVYLVGPGTEVPGHDVIRLEEQEQADETF